MNNEIFQLRMLAVFFAIPFYAWLFMISTTKLFPTSILIFGWIITVAATYQYFKLLWRKQ
jgi:hypothetical protein